MTNGITGSQGWTILKALAKNAGIEGELTSKDVEKIMKSADTNNDGKISIDEFTAAAQSAVDATEEQYLEAFKVISKNDGDDTEISDDDILKAIEDFTNGVENTDSTKASDSTKSSDSTKNNVQKKATTDQTNTEQIQITPSVSAVSLTGEEDLETLQTGRSDMLAQLQQKRAEKSQLDSDPAVVQANQNVSNAETSYNDSLTALEQKETNLTETEQAVLEQQNLKKENDAAISEQKQAIATAENNVSSAQSALDTCKGSEPSQSSYTKTQKNADGTTSTVNDTQAYSAAHSEWEAQKNKLEAELANAEVELAQEEVALSELETKEVEIDTAIAEIIQQAEDAGEEVSAELKAVSDNLNAKYDAKNNLAQVKMEKTAQTEVDIAQLQANLEQYTNAISTAKAKENEAKMSEIANDPNQLQAMLDDPELISTHKLQLLNIADTENPDAVEEIKSKNPDFYSDAITDIADDNGNTEEDVKNAVLENAKAEIEQRKNATEAKKDSMSGLGSLWNGVKGIFGGGTNGELNDIADIEKLLEEAEKNPTTENIDKLNKALYGEAVDWVAAAESVSTMNNLAEGAYSINGEIVSRDTIANALSECVDGLESSFKEGCDSAGCVTKFFSWLNNGLGFGTTKNMTQAQFDELQEQVKKLSDPNISDAEFASIYRSITGQSLTENALYELFSGESNPVENSTAAESMMDFENTNQTLKTTAISVVSGALCAIPGVGWAAALAIGVGLNVGVNALDATTQSNGQSFGEKLSTYAKEDLMKDAAVGFVNAFTGKLGNAVGAKLTTLSQTSSSLTGRIAGKAVASFVDGATDGSLSSGAEYFIEQIASGEEIDLSTMGQQMFVGGTFGGLMSVGMDTGLSMLKGAKNGDVFAPFRADANLRTLPDAYSAKGVEFEVDGKKVLDYDGSFFQYDAKAKSWVEMNDAQIDSLIAAGNAKLQSKGADEILALPEGQKPLGLPEGNAADEVLALPEGQKPLELPEGRGDVDTSANARSAADADTGAKVDADADTKVKGDADTNAHTGADADTNGHGSADTQAKTNADVDADAKVKTDADVQTHADVDADAKVKTDADVQTHADVDSDAKVKTDADVQTHADVDSNTKARSAAEPKAHSDVDTNARAVADSDLGVKSDVDAPDTPKADTATYSKSQTLSDVDVSKAKTITVDGKKAKVLDGKCYVLDDVTGKYVLAPEIKFSDADLAKINALNSGSAETVKISRPELDKYVVSSDFSEMSAVDFFNSRTDLFDNRFFSNGYWSEYFPVSNGTNLHSAWKMHMYADDVADWQKMSEVIIPYLKEQGVKFKTVDCTDLDGIAKLNAGGIQKGKAFTIYPESNTQMAKLAQDLDYIIRNNDLELSGSSISGDRALGDSGRLFYRYELKDASMVDSVFDMSTLDGDKAYRRAYDSNAARHASGRPESELYLANGMTSADDPFYYFDPSNPNSNVGDKAPAARPVVSDVDTDVDVDTDADGLKKTAADTDADTDTKVKSGDSADVDATGKKSKLVKKVSDIKDSAAKKVEDIKNKYNEIKQNKVDSSTKKSTDTSNVDSTAKTSSTSKTASAKAKAQDAIEKLRKLVKQGADISKIQSLYSKIQNYCKSAKLTSLSDEAAQVYAQAKKRAAVKAAAGLATPVDSAEVPFVTPSIPQGSETPVDNTTETPATETPSTETPTTGTPTTGSPSTGSPSTGSSPVENDGDSAVSDELIDEEPEIKLPVEDNIPDERILGIGEIDFSQPIDYEDLLSFDNLIFQKSQEYETPIDENLQEVLEASENPDVVIAKDEPLIFHSSETNSFPVSAIGDEYALNVTGSEDFIKELEQLMTTGTYTVVVNGEEQTIVLDDMTKFMFSTVDDASKWNDTDAPVTLYFEGEINEETLAAIELIASKYARGEFPEAEGVDNDVPFMKKYENPTEEQIEELHKKASEIDPEFADAILEQSSNTVGMSGIQYAAALEIIEQYEAYLLNSI